MDGDPQMMNLAMVYEQKDGTFSLIECGGRVNVEDFYKGTAIGTSCSEDDSDQSKITYKVNYYQMQKDTAYVIINERRLSKGGKIIQNRKIYQEKKNFIYQWKELGNDGVLTPKSLKFKK